MRVVYKAAYSRDSRSLRMRHRVANARPASRVCGFVSRFQTSPMPALVTGNLIRAGWSAASTEEAGREAKQAAKVLSDANAKTFLGFLGEQHIINESTA